MGPVRDDPGRRSLLPPRDEVQGKPCNENSRTLKPDQKNPLNGRQTARTTVSAHE